MRVQFGSQLAEAFIADPASFRPMVWSTLVYFFLRYTQLFWVMIVVALVGPKLVSQDLQSRSLALYFAKPLTRFDYVLGKLAVVGFWVAMVTLVPTLVLYALSILFSPSAETLAQTITVVPRVITYSLLLVIGTGAPMLALSSLTPNARFLGFLWAGVWVMTHVASFILSVALFLGKGGPKGGFDAAPVRDGSDWTGLVSYFKNLDSVAYRLLDLDVLLTPAAELSPRASRWLTRLSYDHDWRLSLAIVIAVSIASLVVVSVRIGRPGEAGSK
jgi:ABC-type transport system involved in multi-copper enzyme maturation permease subunit